MTLVRLGYVAMSVLVHHASPSQTMTLAHFKKIPDREAAVRKLALIAESNLHNCLRLLKHNAAHDIRFFRLSSKLIPLATHDELRGWNYIRPLESALADVGAYAKAHGMRLDFHPDHFIVLNTAKKDVLKSSIKNLRYHARLLKGMDIPLTHRSVIHIGGKYESKERALERFVENWAVVPKDIQRMLMLENDDKSFHLQDTLYLCEKLGIPLVFDYHHHLANASDDPWEREWERVLKTWRHSPLPVKMHISSPKSERQFRAHHDHIDPEMFLAFLQKIKGSVPQIDCMVEAKRKDEALLKLMEDMKRYSEIEIVDQASFYIKD